MDCENPYVFYPDNCEAYFFQESGTLTVTGNDDNTDKDGNITGTLSAKLIEVDMSGTEDDIDSTPITNGRCVEIESGGEFASTKDCPEITIGKNLTYNSGTDRYNTTNCTPNYGDIMTPDTFSMKFKNITPSGEYNLAGTNYGDGSGIFFVLYEDNGAKYFFQKSGTVNITGSSTAVLTDLVLEEVTFNNGNSVKTNYGSCRKIKNTTINF